MSDATIRLLQAVERSASTPIDGNLCREVIAENIRLRDALLVAAERLEARKHVMGAREARAALTTEDRADG